ncbi:MAG: hypothetical protein K0B87_03720 [Candidatus Syntrophosphaera sp.]|nr:hypothetical protein [Candidatus Syntrophosphaera sp.]
MLRKLHPFHLRILILSLFFLFMTIQIAALEYHALALRSDGTLAAWGEDYNYGLDNVPTGYDFVAIATGSKHSLALTSAGNVVAWGDNYHGQLNVPAGHVYTRIPAGNYHSGAITSEGTVVAWGSNEFGLTEVPAGGGFTDLACGGRLSFALREVPDRDRLVWIHNLRGQPVASVQLRRGQTTADWDGKDASGNLCASGVYLYHCQGLGPQAGGKFLILK